MNKLSIFEIDESGKEFLNVDISLNDINFIPGFIRTTLDSIKTYHKYVKVITHDDKNTETEYFENSVRSNRWGAAYIDRNGNKEYYILGKITENSEKLQNDNRKYTLREILKEVLEDQELPQSGLD